MSKGESEKLGKSNKRAINFLTLNSEPSVRQQKVEVSQGLTHHNPILLTIISIAFALNFYSFK